MTYRQKFPVLCFYEYAVKDPREGGIDYVDDTVMIHVEFPDQVESEFHRVMQARVRDGRSFSRRPLSWKLKKILAPQHVSKAAS